MTDRGTIRHLIEQDSVPREGDDPAFESPWQARAFGLAVALERGEELYEWRAFQERFADEIAAGESRADPDSVDPESVEDDYYEQWLAAVERLLVEEGHLTDEEIERRAAEFADGDRTAAEFVEGEHEH